MDFNQQDADDAQAELARQDRTMRCNECSYEWSKYDRGAFWCPQCASTDVISETDYLEAHSEDHLD